MITSCDDDDAKKRKLHAIKNEINLQIACCLTDIHLTFLMQPVPLYPLISGYVLGFSVYLGANTHHCMCVITFLFIYQIGSMIACFIKKHQAIAATLKRYLMPKTLVFVMGGYVLIYTFSVTGVYATLSVPDKDKLDYVRRIACSLTDIHLTFLMQPVPLYPIFSGYILGFSVYLGATIHHCMCIIIFLLIYQIGSMITCFVRKHQAIAGTLKRYRISNLLVFIMLLYVFIYTCSVTGIFATCSVPDGEKLNYVRKNYPEYLSGFESIPNFSIYDPSDYFANFVIYSLVGGIIAFLTLVAVLLNIFRMLSVLKSKLSASTYQKHRSAIYSLLAQFATSSVIFVPPIFFVFIVLMGINGAQLIVEYLVVIASFHSSLNSIVLITTFPPYRRFVINLILRKDKAVQSTRQKPASGTQHLHVEHQARNTAASGLHHLHEFRFRKRVGSTCAATRMRQHIRKPAATDPLLFSST
ncbi:hypothetical protein GCK72_006870 [Caenorhabditis remanei]|uniref:Uncharacterized protein n=1 Tax=Caenorhabditis remanei TaxID=31234 RepID=A0A6A5HM45_CAERE|nr:hypothetical protein GCK72_006870 [Caenorhabditis remanei]KAF1766912.1 hypothetical protein GCK72_006870 [Caenorhabditis remanei]